MDMVKKPEKLIKYFRRLKSKCLKSKRKSYSAIIENIDQVINALSLEIREKRDSGIKTVPRKLNPEESNLSEYLVLLELCNELFSFSKTTSVKEDHSLVKQINH